MLDLEADPLIDADRAGGAVRVDPEQDLAHARLGGGAEHVCPAKIDPIKTKQIQEQALRAFRALGLVVYGRVDILLSDSGEPFVLEVNTIPGMTEASLLPEAAAAAGINYVDLCVRIIALSRARMERSPR